MDVANIERHAVAAGSREAFTSGGLRRDFSFNANELLAFAESVIADAMLNQALDADAVAAQALDALRRENESLQRELLTPEVFQRVTEWLRRDPIPRASSTFTASLPRQIGYLLEETVIPELKSARLVSARANPF